MSINIKKYIEIKYYKDSKWDHSLMFSGTTDRKMFSEIDFLKYVGESKF